MEANPLGFFVGQGTGLVPDAARDSDPTEVVYERWQDIIGQERIVLFLPLAHTFARMISFLGALPPHIFAIATLPTAAPPHHRTAAPPHPPPGPL